MLRTLLILGRVSNLPTVWSNLLIGWLIITFYTYKSGPDITAMPLLMLLGGSLIYVGGMYLNDFCDAVFDSQYCPQRPIPSGKISRRAVGFIAVFCFATGLACALLFGRTTILLTLLLIAAVVLYDFHHKNVFWAPFLMGGCRLLLYPLGASTMELLASDFPGSTMFWMNLGWGCAVAFYVAGITFLARGESRPGKTARWALFFLFIPTLSALSMTLTTLGFQALFLVAASLPSLAWMAWLIIPLLKKTKPSIGRVVSGLLAGLILIDFIIFSPMLFILPISIFLYPLLFGLALILQRHIPAT